MEVRLNKMLSDAGLCSRREADEYIKEGRVRVNDDLPRVGQKVTENDKVTLDDVNVTISKKSLRDAEAAKLPKVRNDVKKESAAGEGRTSGTRPEKKGGLRPGKYGKYNKYAAARARARAHGRSACLIVVFIETKILGGLLQTLFSKKNLFIGIIKIVECTLHLDEKHLPIVFAILSGDLFGNLLMTHAVTTSPPVTDGNVDCSKTKNFHDQRWQVRV